MGGARCTFGVLPFLFLLERKNPLGKGLSGVVWVLFCGKENAPAVRGVIEE
jgi:hypothetical protein